MDFVVLGLHRLVLRWNVLGLRGRRAAQQVMEFSELHLCAGRRVLRGATGPSRLRRLQFSRGDETYTQENLACSKNRNKYVNRSPMTGQRPSESSVAKPGDCTAPGGAQMPAVGATMACECWVIGGGEGAPWWGC